MNRRRIHVGTEGRLIVGTTLHDTFTLTRSLGGTHLTIQDTDGRSDIIVPTAQIHFVQLFETHEAEAL